MSKEKLTEELHVLEELLGKVTSLIHPISVDAELEWLQSKENRGTLFEKKPKCFLPIKMGAEVPFFPICNRTGAIQPEIIDFSLKLANKAMGHDKVDQAHLGIIISRLTALQARYNKDIPKPANMAAKKGLTTKMLNKIKNYLGTIR